MLIGGMVNHQFDDHPDLPTAGLFEEILEILESPVGGVYGKIIGDIIAVVAHRRWIKRKQPKRVDSQFLEVSQLLAKSAKIPDAVAGAVVK